MYCALSITSRTSSTPVLLAASISSRSMKRPASMSRQVAHSPQGSADGALLAVQRFGEDAGDGGLADAARAGEQEGVVDAAGIERIGERADHVFLPDQFGETLRAPLAGEDEIGHGRHSAMRQCRSDRDAGAPVPRVRACPRDAPAARIAGPLNRADGCAALAAAGSARRGVRAVEGARLESV